MPTLRNLMRTTLVELIWGGACVLSLVLVLGAAPFLLLGGRWEDLLVVPNREALRPSGW